MSKGTGMEGLPLGDVAYHSVRRDNAYPEIPQAEIQRRIAQAQIDTAKYMRWSVVALVITAGATTLFQAMAWLWPNPLHFR